MYASMVFYTNCTICWCQQTSFSTKSLLNMPKNSIRAVSIEKSWSRKSNFFLLFFSRSLCVFLGWLHLPCFFVFDAITKICIRCQFNGLACEMPKKTNRDIYYSVVTNIFLWQFSVTMTDRYACIVFIQCASHWNFEINMHICRMLSVLMEWKKIFWFWIILMRYPHSGCPRLLFLILLLLLLSKVKIPMILFVTYSRTLFHTLFHIFTFTYAHTYIHT